MIGRTALVSTYLESANSQEQATAVTRQGNMVLLLHRIAACPDSADAPGSSEMQNPFVPIATG
jgi:hypothetical protein